MTSTSQTLKRLGVATVGACTLLSTPYLGAVAFAGVQGAAPTAAEVTITSQVTGNASARNDGTDATVTVTANVAYAPSVATDAVPADNTNAPSAVRFSYSIAGGTEVLIGTDAYAPYSVQWTPPASGGTGYKLFAEALNASGVAYTSAAKSVAASTSVVDAPTVHVLSRTTGYSAASTIVVSGTRSADLPAIDLYTQVRDNATGVLSPTKLVVDPASSNPNPAPTVIAGTVAAGTTTTGTQSWTTVATIPANTPANADVLVTAVARGTAAGTADDSDDLAESPLYAQALTTFGVTPAVASRPIDSITAYTVAALDQKGLAYAGLALTATGEGVTALSGATDAAGLATFNGAAAKDSRTFVVKTTGLASNFTRSATLTGYASVPTVLTLAATPAKALYTASEYTSAAPTVELCVTDQSGNGTPAATNANLIVTQTRTDKATTVALPAKAVTAGVTVETGTKANCYLVAHTPASTTSGSDTFNAYFDNDGTPGFNPTFTSGFGSADVAAAPLTVKYADLKITALDTQTKKGTATTVSFKVLGADGTPFVGRKITLTTATDATSGFTATQPTGTTAPTAAAPSAVIATTDANGIASAIVNSLPTATVTTVSVPVVASDNISNTLQIPTGQAKTATVEFRALAVALTTITKVDGSNQILTPAGGSAFAARPGDVVTKSFSLKDANGGLLLNAPVTLTLDHGFFTKSCVTATVLAYSNCDVVTAPAAGVQVGNIKPIGQTMTVTSDAFGVVNTTFAIGRDAAFDVNGSVTALLTAVANGGTATAIEAGVFTTATAPINGGTVTLVPITSTPLPSDVQQSRTATANAVKFAVHVTDQFGNLTNDLVKLAVTGGKLDTAQILGSFTGTPGVVSLISDTTSTAGAMATVTATYAAPVTTFVNTAVASATPVYATPVGTPVNKTATFAANFYTVDLANLTFAFTSTPAASVVVNTVVTTSVTVTDQKGNPVAGLTVNFLRTDATTIEKVTNALGKAGISFTTGTVGTSTVTAIFTDGSGNELGRGAKVVTFTAPVVPVVTPTTAPVVPVTLAGSALLNPAAGSTVVITGTTAANTVVTLHFHKGGTPASADVTRTVTSDAAGNFSRAIVANVDYRYFATVGTSTSQRVLSQPVFTISGNAAQTVAKGKTFTSTGTAFAGAPVYLHFRTGTKGAFTVVRVTANAAGIWTRPVLASGVYSLFVTRNAADTTGSAVTVYTAS